jgi:alkylation response protein AidB-like acyl-CoA dehydrogenase
VEFGWSEEDTAFRKELRAFIESELDERWTGPVRHLGSPENVANAKDFNRKLAERGWLTPHWPVEYGGHAATPWQHIILGEELWSVGEPRGPQYMNVNWIGPSILAHGSDEQRRELLPPIARGEVVWCQGFSEPDAGSDLASLRTSARLDGDEYVVSGQKSWTSYASVADYCYLLVRTDPAAPRHKGISVLLVPTDTPGFVISEVPSMVGEHAFHDLFFDEMRVPASSLLGPENEGWAVVRGALSYERVGAPRYARALVVLADALQWVHEHGIELTEPVQERVDQARAACEAARMLAYRVIDQRASNLPPSATSNLARAAMVHAERLVGNLVFEMLGADALRHGSLADESFRKSLAAGIAAGSYEMQLNLVASQLLGLPKV